MTASFSQAAAERLCDGPLLSVRPVSGSGNSRVFRVETKAGLFALKIYPPFAQDDRRRREREVAAMAFIAGRPELGLVTADPVASDPNGDIALFGWLDGLRPLPATDGDVKDLAALACRFLPLSSAPGADAFPDAVEATLSPAELVRQIRDRLDRLAPVRAGEPQLDAWLQRQFTPQFERLTEGLSSIRSDAPCLRVLSPSDFGLHNTLRLADGRLALVDLEYFGWDDPVRLLVDVICHPAMRLGPERRALFLRHCLPQYAVQPGLIARMTALAPIIALRWALIVLNEFLPCHWRRRVAAGAMHPWTEAKAAQLDKARQMLDLSETFVRQSWSDFLE
jgi:hypothetical protein